MVDGFEGGEGYRREMVLCGGVRSVWHREEVYPGAGMRYE